MGSPGQEEAWQMTQASELVKSLREIVADFGGLKPYIVVCAEDAASLIESQEEEIKRLRAIIKAYDDHAVAENRGAIVEAMSALQQKK
jgi:hypothetical protein